MAGKNLQPVLLADQFLAISDLYSLDQRLLCIVDVERLGILQLGQQLVDRQHDLLLLDPPVLLLDQRQVSRKSPSTSLHPGPEWVGGTELLVEDTSRRLGQEQHRKSGPFRGPGLRAEGSSLSHPTAVGLLGSHQVGRTVGIPVAVTQLVELGQRTHSLESVQVIQGPLLQPLHLDDGVVASQPGGTPLDTSVNVAGRHPCPGGIRLLGFRLGPDLLLVVFELLEIDRLQHAELGAARRSGLGLWRLRLCRSSQALGVGVQEQLGHHQAAGSGSGHAVTGIAVEVTGNLGRRMVGEGPSAFSLELCLDVPLCRSVPGIRRHLHPRTPCGPQAQHRILGDRRVAVVVL